jgi:hypothetical protein
VLIAKLCQVELGEAFGIGQEVDLGDLAILDREGGDRERPSVKEADHTGRAVDQSAPHCQVDAGPEQRLASDCLSTSDVLRYARKAAIGSEYDIGIENGDERIEVTLPGRCEERLGDLPLSSEVGVWNGRAAAYAVPGARSIFSAMRATTVVSQPPRFSTSLVSARLSRSQAS